MEFKPSDKPLKIAICEDSLEETAKLSSLIESSGISYCCDTFNNAESFIAAFQPGSYDLIFFDIYMGTITGVEAAAKVREWDDSVSLVFTTFSPNHTLESYRLGAIRYLEKPLSQKAVKEALKMALNLRNMSQWSVLSEGKPIEISLSSIMYFELRNRNVIINTAGEEIALSRTIKLGDIEKLLPDNFFRCHHSYIVNFAYVSMPVKELRSFLMRNGGYVHIRRQDVHKSIEAYETYLFDRLRKHKALK